MTHSLIYLSLSIFSQIAKQHEHCPPGALVWDANNDPPGTTPKPLDEYDNGGVSSGNLYTRTAPLVLH